MKKEEFANMNDDKIDKYLTSIQVVPSETSPDNDDDYLLYLSAIREVKKQIGFGKSRVGYITCPKCGADLQYFIHTDNQHTMGRCPTDGCIKWME